MRSRNRLPRRCPMPSDPSAQISQRKLRFAGIVAGFVIVVVVVTGIVLRESGTARLREWADEQAIPTVAVSKPFVMTPSAHLTRPGRGGAGGRAPGGARGGGGRGGG